MSLSKEHLRLWLRLLKSTRQIEAHLREQLRVEFSTTLPRFDVMSALDRFPDGLRMSQLSRELRVSNGNVTGIIDRLVEEGLVARAQVQGDRRAFVVALTDAGKSEFTKQADAHEGWVSEMMAGVSEQEAAQMMALLEQLSEDAGEQEKEKTHAQ
ncbi:MAG: MarR family transcriptional regulator [Pelagimonas sp.]|jgi:DNA-binding MarR family transcriptional regulator|nr:MarR family transcriptional regulator [Pelagimonas sp.]